jgi:hypothetical protein
MLATGASGEEPRDASPPLNVEHEEDLGLVEKQSPATENPAEGNATAGQEASMASTPMEQPPRLSNPTTQNQEDEGQELTDSNDNFQILPSNKPTRRRSRPRLSPPSLSIRDSIESKVTEPSLGIHPRLCACIVVNYISAGYILLPHGK